MKKQNLFLVVIIMCFTSFFCHGQQETINVPKSEELKESGKNQRRDLSIPNSRIVLNFFDFQTRHTASEYSNHATLPLNIAWLSTKKNNGPHHIKTRMNRAVPDLLRVHKSENIQSIIKDSTSGQAISFHTEWTPHALAFTARYEDGTVFNGLDFLYNENTVIRKLNSTKSNSRFISFSGRYEGEIKFVDNKIIVINNNIRYCIMFNHDVENFVLSDKNWAVNLNGNILNESTVISVAFAEKGESVEELVNKAEKPIINKDVDKQLEEREKYWDNFLAKVPHPKNFEFSKVDPDGVTSEQLRLAYYKAWIFTAQNILPEDKELYPYPQIVTGKPSLWDMGEDRAPFSAAWESFYGIQLYSYIDPELSWKAFKGIMSLVDEDGMLGGESLPSRKAQTAMILYFQTEDKKSLEEVYPALERYLNWRMKITHWVFKEIVPNEKTKDAEFAFAALVDMEHMAKIAEILGKAEDVKEWRERHKEFSEKALEWFWEKPDSKPVQMYNTETKKRGPGHPVWITTGLYVDDLLSTDYKRSMVNLFDQDYDPESRFAGFNLPKYPDISYTVYGLLKHGLTDRALGVVEANLRDIMKSNSVFAEQYIGEDFQPDGVRPALFGSSTVIDFIWLLNGYKYDRGRPELVIMPVNKNRGLNNIHFNGETYNLWIEGANNKAFWGKFSKEPKELKPIKNLSKMRL